MSKKNPGLVRSVVRMHRPLDEADQRNAIAFNQAKEIWLSESRWSVSGSNWQKNLNANGYIDSTRGQQCKTQ